MTIKKLVKICHEIAKSKGFWSEECKNCQGTGKVWVILEKRKKRNCPFCNGLGQRSINRNDGEMIALIHSELSEALEALRKGDHKELASEMADVVIRVADYCGGRNIDLEKEILKKIKKNKKRPYRHNKRF